MYRLLLAVVVLLLISLSYAEATEREIEMINQPKSDIDKGSTTKTSRKSWFNRIFDSFVSAILGIVLFFFTFAVITASEGVYVTRLQSIDKISDDLVSTDAELGRHLFYTSDTIRGTHLQDKTFGISSNCLRMRRVTEMYQYYEETSTKTVKDSVGGGETTQTTYTLKTDWFDYLPALSGNADGSPPGGNPSFPTISDELIMSREFCSSELSIEGHKLSESQIQRVSEWGPLKCKPPSPGSLPVSHGSHLSDQCSVYLPTGSATYGTFNDSKPGTPSVGDVRIKWEIIPEGIYTVMCGKQDRNLCGYRVPGVSDYQLPFICYPCTCGIGAMLINLVSSSANVIDDVRFGSHSAIDIIASLRREASITSWGFRILVFFLFMMSTFMILSPLPTILDVIGFVGDIARFGTFFIAIVVSLIITPLAVAVAWVAYRPVIAFYITVPPFFIWYYFATTQGM